MIEPIRLVHQERGSKEQAAAWNGNVPVEIYVYELVQSGGFAYHIGGLAVNDGFYGLDEETPFPTLAAALEEARQVYAFNSCELYGEFETV